MDWLVFCLLRVPTFLSANSEIDRRRTIYRPVRRSLPVQALGGVSRSEIISRSRTQRKRTGRNIKGMPTRHTFSSRKSHVIASVSNPSLPLSMVFISGAAVDARMTRVKSHVI